MSQDEFERELKNFRGTNNKRVSRDDKSQLLVDTVDVGLYGKIDPRPLGDVTTIRYQDNRRLWKDLIDHRVSHGDSITLEKFHLTEWVPSAPGRYFTPEAAKRRQYANEFRQGFKEYLPLGKLEMVLGGVGCVRLAPRIVKGGEVCFFSASSNAISHQGIPIVLTVEDSLHVIREIKTHGSCCAMLTGSLWSLPVEESPIKFDRGIPRYYLFAKQVQVVNAGARSVKPLVTIAITYSSSYEGTSLPLGGIQVNPSKNWSFASFNPAGGIRELRASVEWLRQYATRYSTRFDNGVWKEMPSEQLSILGDFDEIEEHFQNPIEFPLRTMLHGRYDPRLLDFYSSFFHITINKEIVMGDKFENVHNATIINRSVVRDAIKTTQASAGPEVAEALAQLAEVVERSNNAAAGALFNSFTSELQKKEPDKSTLRQCWDGLKSILPDIASLAGVGAKIASLFM